MRTFLLLVTLIVSLMPASAEQKFLDEAVYDFVKLKITENYSVPSNFIIDKILISQYSVQNLYIEYKDSPIFVKQIPRIVEEKTIENCSADPFEDRLKVTEVASIATSERSLSFYQDTAKRTSSTTVKGDGKFISSSAGGWNASVSAEFSSEVSSEIIHRQEEEKGIEKKVEIKTETERNIVVPKFTVRRFSVMEPRDIYKIEATARIQIESDLIITFIPSPDVANMGFKFKADPHGFKLSLLLPSPTDRILSMNETFSYRAGKATSVRITDLDTKQYCEM